MQSFLAVIGLVLIILITLAFIGYSAATNRIIRSQEKEIARLQTQLKRERRKEPLTIIQDGKNPKFGDF